jgi:hypothetical protein
VGGGAGLTAGARQRSAQPVRRRGPRDDSDETAADMWAHIDRIMALWPTAIGVRLSVARDKDMHCVRGETERVEVD